MSVEFAFDADEDHPLSLASVSRAIQTWTLLQPAERIGIMKATVAEAAAAFNLPPEKIIEAVDGHYWMFLSGPRDDYARLTIMHEGE